MFEAFYSAHLEKFRPGKNGHAMALCPFHDDTNPSLSIDIKTGLWYCFGCGESGTVWQFAKRLGVGPPQDGHSGDRGPQEAYYDYLSVEGALLFQVVRSRGKKFWQRRPDGNGGFVSGRGDVPPVLYRLPDLKRARDEGQTGPDTIPRIKVGKYIRFDYQAVMDWLGKNERDR